MGKESKKDESVHDWLDVLKTEQGRRVMREIIDISGYMRPGFTGESEGTIHNCGMQKVGEYIDGRCRANAPAMYVQMIKEQLNG